jgi:arylsulfatase A-like enzyme
MSDTRPNIVLITADQISAHHLGCYGDPAQATPNLDGLGRKGVRCNQTYCAAPVCIPARASMYSGLYPHTHGKVTHLRMAMQPRPPLLPEVLARHGYRTAIVGKSHFYPPDDPIGCQIAHLTIDALLAYELVPNDAYVRSLEQRGVLDEIGLTEFTPEQCRATALQIRSLPEPLHRATWTGDTGCTVLRQLAERDEPFFLYCSFVEPHGPEPCPPEYASKFAGKIREPITRLDELAEKPPIQRMFRDHYAKMLERNYGIDYESMRQRFYGLINLVDHNVGKLLQTLDELGRRGDTVVIFVTDHGESLGDHGMWGKCMFYDSCARVPLLVAGPGVECDQVCDALVSHVDLMPTILEMCGIACEDLLLDGCSILDLLRDPRRPGQDAVFSELYQNQCLPDGLLCNCKMVRSGRWKYVYYTHESSEELYDLAKDPHELYNLAIGADYRSTLDRFRARLLQWLSETEANRLHPTADSHYPLPRWHASRG